MSDDEHWITTDEDTSISDGSPDPSVCCCDDDSSDSPIDQEDPCKTYRHQGCHDPKHVRAIDRQIKEHKQLLSIMLGVLGGFYRDRYLHLEEIDDLNQSIKYVSHAVALSPDQSHLVDDLAVLSACHHDRFHILGTSEDLDKEIETTIRASALGHAYNSRFRCLKNLGDLDRAIEYGTLAISLTPQDKLEFLERLDALNDAYALRSESPCTTDEVEKGIKYGTLATTLTPEGDTNLPWRLRTLSLIWCKAFYHRGDPTALDSCIEWGARAVTIMPEDHPHLSDQINNLASSYRLRFVRLKDPDDLQRAIELGNRALSLNSDDDRSRFITFSNLSSFCLSRFEFKGKVEDLEMGIEYSAQASSLATPGISTATGSRWELESDRLNTLAGLYFARSEYLEDIEDLECAIECCKLAISLAPDENSRSVAIALYSLGHYMHTRWHLLGDTKDLEDDIEYKTRALALVTSDRHPNLPTQLQNLGLSHIATFQLTECGAGCPTLRHALDYFQQASRAVGPPLERIKAALRWAYYARENDMPECLDAYQVAMDLIPQVIWLGATVTRRFIEAEELRSLAIEATSAAIIAHDYNKALEWLEQGRSIVMNQVSTLRSPLTQLRAIHPALADKLQELSRELHLTSSRNENFPLFNHHRPTMHSDEENSHRHRRLAKEYTDLISEIRRLPGFADYFRPKKTEELITAADTGPIVIVNSYDCCRCDALIVRPGIPKLTHIELPSFSCDKASKIQKLRTSLTRGNLAERTTERRPVLETDEISEFEYVLVVLWKDIVKPILDILGYKPNPPDSELPHITWYLTGDLTFLPIHAAGDYRSTESCLFHYAVSSYTPSLTALLSSRSGSSPLSEHSSILLIGQEDTPGHSALPGTAEEIAIIQKHAGEAISCIPITGEMATTKAALDAMEGHDWVHLACHAHQNVGDPTESGFFLHDGTLDLASIMRRSFKNKGLAFLSACQTAKGDKEIPDETVHLASGLLTAGYPSVIATMWSIWDKDAPFVADKVYGYLFKDGKMNRRESARALHYAIAELRKKIGEDSFVRWVPFIHIGS